MIKLRDLFWLILVVALIMSHVAVHNKRPGYIMCPCCSSMYEINEWTRVLGDEIEW
jgi:hypothetical protein